MMYENDILLDECMTEVSNILKNSLDWQDAIEQLAENFPTLDDKKIVQIIMNYFFTTNKTTKELVQDE